MNQNIPGSANKTRNRSFRIICQIASMPEPSGPPPPPASQPLACKYSSPASIVSVFPASIWEGKARPSSQTIRLAKTPATTCMRMYIHPSEALETTSGVATASTIVSTAPARLRFHQRTQPTNRPTPMPQTKSITREVRLSLNAVRVAPASVSARESAGKSTPVVMAQRSQMPKTTATSPRNEAAPASVFDCGDCPLIFGLYICPFPSGEQWIKRTWHKLSAYVEGLRKKSAKPTTDSNPALKCWGKAHIERMIERLKVPQTKTAASACRFAPSTRNEVFNLRHLSRQRCSHPLHAVCRNQHVVLHTHADAFVFFKRRADCRDELFVLDCLGKIIERVGPDIDARFVREDHARLQPRAVVPHVMHVHSQPVRRAVHEPDAILVGASIGN